MRVRTRRFSRSICLSAVIFGIICIDFAPRSSAATPPTFDPKPWLQDLEQVKDALATKYANFEWLVFEHETDLNGLFADTRARIESASSQADARAALDRLARKLGDGHVRFR